MLVNIQTPDLTHKKIPLKNKIRGSRVETVVIDMLLRDHSWKAIQQVLENDYNFTAAHDTIGAYDKYFFRTKSNALVARLVEEAERLYNIDQDTEEKILKKNFDQVQSLMALVEYHQKKIAALEKRADASRPRTKNAIEGLIFKHSQQLKDVRMELAQLKEGPQGQDAKSGAIIKVVVEACMRAMIKYIPDEMKKQATIDLKQELKKIKVD